MKNIDKRLSTVVLLIAITVLISWEMDWMLIVQVADTYIPMPPTSAILFLLSSSALCLFSIKNKTRWIQFFSNFLAFLVLLLSIPFFSDLFFYNYEFEITLLHNKLELGNIHSGMMSEITIVSFILLGLALVFLNKKNHLFYKNSIGVIASLLFFSSSISLIGYTENIPVLYGSNIIPISLLSAISFFLLSMVLLSFIDYQFWPFYLLSKSTVQSKLIRIFMPIIVGFVLIDNYTEAHLLDGKEYGALTSSIILIIFLLVIVIIIAFVSKNIGKNLEKAELNIKQSEERFKLVAKATNEVIWEQDFETKKIWRSDNFTLIFGWNLDEFGNTDEELLKKIHPDDVANISNNISQFLLSKDEIWEAEYRMLKKDGTYAWVCDRAYLLKYENGTPIRVVGSMADITLRKRAELVQNIILNISNASQTEMDLEELLEFIQKELGRIVDTKNFFVAFYNKENDTLHIPYYKDMGGDDVLDFPADESISGLVIKKGVSLLLDESQMYELEKEKIAVIGPVSKSWLGVPLKIKREIVGVFVVQSYEDEKAYSEDDKEILEIVSQQISISIERKRNEEQLLKALEKAKESDRLKSAFIANMSHEIRTPMNGILGFTGLLKSSDLSSDKQEKYINIIEKSGARLLTTIDDIMNISKIESGLIKISLSEINLNDQIEELYAFFKPEAENKGLQLLVVNSILEDEFIVKTDEEKLHSILVNLIKNAIKYTKQGSVEFGCFKKGNHLEIYVKDTGIGIAKDRQPYVFDRFVQADIEDKAVYEGSGLGLAISKSYVEMLGGGIELESVEGIGSTFSFTLPCQAINKEIQVAKKETSIDFVASEIPSLKVLIVEDDMIAQLYLEELLTDVSKEILYADNGYTALDLCREKSDIDLILMDIRMPGINGFEVTKQIRQFNKEVIIIAQTAFAFSGDREKTLDAGCNDYISKPINKDYLVALIQKYFKK